MPVLLTYRMNASVASSAIHATSNAMAAASSQRRRDGDFDSDDSTIEPQLVAVCEAASGRSGHNPMML
jgi:hypothetical protein